MGRRHSPVMAAAFILAIPVVSHASDINIYPIPGASDGEIGAFVVSLTGQRVAFSTATALVPEDSNAETDGYLFNLDDGSLTLLRPEPASGTITLGEGRQSFHPIAFSADGNQLLMSGTSDVGRSAEDTASGLVVFDFTTATYELASRGEDNAPVDAIGGELSADSRHVFFKTTDSASGSAKFYRRNLETDVTAIALDGRNDDGQLDLLDVSANGNRMLVSLIRSDDVNGAMDYFVIDVEAETRTRIDPVLADGTRLGAIGLIEASPSMDYLLIDVKDFTTTFAGKTVNEFYAVYNVNTDETLPLTDFLDPGERHEATYAGTSNGFYRAHAGSSDRYVILAPGFLAMPGDYGLGGRLYIYDRETGQAWVPGMDNDGNVHMPVFAIPRGLHGGAIFGGVTGTEPDLHYSVIESMPVAQDLELMATSSSERHIELTLRNNGTEDIHNVGLMLYTTDGAFGSLRGIDECVAMELPDPAARVDCRIGTLGVGETLELETTAAPGSQAVVEAVSLSDPDSDFTDNRVVLTVKGSATPDSGGSGGGGAGAALLALFAFAGWRRRRT